MQWLAVREYLRARRPELTAQAVRHYPSLPRIAGTPLSTRPAWLPAAPVALTSINLVRRDHEPGAALPVSHLVPVGFDSEVDVVDVADRLRFQRRALVLLAF